MSHGPERPAATENRDPVFVPACGRRRGILFVLSGPSGVGKDTVLAEFRNNPGMPQRCVTVTTRPPREGEVQGVHYHFVNDTEFAELVSSGGLLEWAVVHGHRYGTPRTWVRDRLADGQDVILNVDVQGGRSIRALAPDAVTMFLLPPSWEELARRLRARRTDSGTEIERRLADGRLELMERTHYTYWIVNDSVARAAAALSAIVTAERCRARHWQEPPADEAA
jgi:guanylate kinase